jgi:ArsR family transcriptional regulator
MDNSSAVIAFSALAQETRLAIFRLLVEHGREGTAAGVLGDTLGIPHNTLSFHLSHLSQAGLVSSQRDGRRIIYKANLDIVQSLAGFLMDNCCTRESNPSACKPRKKKK